jgi:hypothetical protein
LITGYGVQLDKEAEEVSSFFKVGERYRDRYAIESVEAFLDGELAVARTDENEWYYLQLTKLKKGTQSRVIQQYLVLDHPLVLPYVEVYTEERFIVFIRPYIALTPLNEQLPVQPWSEEETVRLTRDLVQLERMLNSRPLPMYLVLDPRNIRLTEDGQLKVFFCGVTGYTALEPVIDWGTWMYMCMTGQILEEPLAKLPPDRPFSKEMVRLIERSLKRASASQVLSQMETYEKRKNSPGLLGRLFGGDSRRPREEKQEERGLNLPPPLKPARTDSSEEGKGKPLFGERIKPKMPSGSTEGLAAPLKPTGLSPAHDRAFPAGEETSPSAERPEPEPAVEAPKVSTSVTPADSPRASTSPAPADSSKASTPETPADPVAEADAVEIVPPSAEGQEEEPPVSRVEVPKAETSAPSADIDREPAPPQDSTATTDAPEVEGPGLAPEGKEEDRSRPSEPSPEEREPAGVEPQPLILDISPSPDTLLESGSSGATVDDSVQQKQEQEQQEQVDRLIRERLIRERQEHDRLASQFREYAKMIQSGGGNP